MATSEIGLVCVFVCNANFALTTRAQTKVNKQTKKVRFIYVYARFEFRKAFSKGAASCKKNEGQSNKMQFAGDKTHS